MPLRPLRPLLLGPLALLLAACGRGETRPLLTGTLHDSAVAGLAFRTPTQSGTTDSQGRFTYREGETVTFQAGATPLGSAPGAPDLALTALDGGRLTRKVVNAARLLQTLDADGDPENGLQVAGIAETLPALDLTLPTADMDRALDQLVRQFATTGQVRTLRGEAEALEHLESTLAAQFRQEGTTTLTDGTQVTKRLVQVPASERIAYPGSDAGVKAAFPQGFPLSIGSGLAYRDTRADGTVRFWGLTDRGPNGDAPDFNDGTTKAKTKSFPVPAFTPRLVCLELRDGVARVASTIPLINEKGAPLTGLPLPLGSVGSTLEVPLSETLRPLAQGYDALGLDPEGVAVDPRDPGILWLCDEYGPFLVKVEAATGKILQRFGPGSGLPALLQYRQPNRGFEGVAAVDGRLFGMIQSILDFNQKVGSATPYSTSKARFLRLVELDPATGATRMFAYPHDVDTYAKSKDAKVGDLVALGGGRFLVLEQGADKTGKMRNLIYLVDVKGATDLTGVQPGGREPEALASDQALRDAGIVPARKILLLDLREAGWIAEKAEGLTLLPDGQTLVVANDNDFGLKASVAGGPSQDPTEYAVDAAGGLSLGGTPVAGSYQIRTGSPVERPSRLWSIRLPRPVSTISVP